MNKPANLRPILLIVTASTLGLIAQSASAVTHTWAASPVNDQMSNILNWVGGVPVSGSPNLQLDFGVTNASSVNQNIAPTLQLQSMNFTAALFYQTYGNALEFKNLGAAPTITLATSSQTFILNDITFTDPTSISTTGSAFMSLNGVLAGADLSLSAAASTQFSFGGAAANTLGGTTTVGPGAVLNLNKSAGVVALSGMLDVAGGQVTVGATGQLGAGTDVTVSNNGYMQANAATTVDDLELNSGGIITPFSFVTLTIAGNITSSGGVSTIAPTTIGATAVDFAGTNKSVNIATGGDMTINATIFNGTITKSGNGRLTLTNLANTITGSITVNGGTLAGYTDSLGSSVVTTAGTFCELITGTLTSDLVSGPGQIVVSGNIAYAAAQSVTGTTLFNNGLATGNTLTLLGDFDVVPTTTGQLTFNQNFDDTYTGTISGAIFVNKSGIGKLTMGGTNPYTLGTQLLDGTLEITSDTAIGTGSLSVFGFSGPSTIEAVGTRVLSNPLLIFSETKFDGAGNIHFTDTTAKIISTTVEKDGTGTTQIDGKFSANASSTITVNNGTLIVGDASMVNGFTAAGPIIINGGTLTARSLNFVTLPNVTLAGGTLNTPNGYAIPLGAVLQGDGAVTGRVASANGSSIYATGTLTIGSTTHVAGVNLDGELYTGANTVQLDDANQAVLGSLTDLGDSTYTNPGALNAANGLVLNFGRNITGFGTITGTNNVLTAMLINGDVNGNGAGITLTGYTKGVGFLNNVTINGSYAPGLSPALVNVGTLTLGSSSTTEVEIGGLLRGSQYDAWDISTMMNLNGTMQVLLINAFNPSLGDQFFLFNGSTSGVFANYSFPALAPGLAWDISDLYSTGYLKVSLVPEPTVLGALSAIGLLTLRRRSR